MIYTKYGYRIIPITEEEVGYNWLFFPGGPGLGSEYLLELCEKIKLPGNIALVDFPMDGTNHKGELGIQYWKDGLIDLVKQFPKAVLVAHSFSGMFALNVPELESYLSGLVLMNTTTADTFFKQIDEMRRKHSLPDLVPAAAQYHVNPSDKTYREFWNTYKYYCFTAEEISEGEKMIPLFAFNNRAYHFAIENFYLGYESKWHPTLIPTLTIASENDYVCPADIFIRDKKYQSENVINKVIEKAGHCPWVMYFEEVQDCFNEFVIALESE